MFLQEWRPKYIIKDIDILLFTILIASVKINRRNNMLQGPPIEGPYTCVRCNRVSPTYYQTIEKFGERTRVYACSSECYSRYHRVSQQFQQQHVTPRTQHNTIKITASVSLDVRNLPNVPDQEPGEPPTREDSQPGKGMADDVPTGAVTVLGMANPPPLTCCQKLWQCFCRCKCKWG